MTLEELHKQCRDCHKCRLREGALQVVPGEGNSHAEIMFIGEAPGKMEDKFGRPFVGPAGKFLDELLKSIDLKREDIFIANMVKCRPPQNREPQEDEMEACKEWLDKQIEVINPRVFVPLGRYALGKFLPNAMVSKEHGKLYSRGGKVYFVMYHPAVALYKGSMRAVLLEDFKNLKRFLDGELEPESLDDVVSEIMKSRVSPSSLKQDDEDKAKKDQVKMF